MEEMQIDLAIDDIRVSQCEPAKECLDTPQGVGYWGKQNTTAHGQACDYWQGGLYVLENLGYNVDGGQ
jgi:hypothetical protein